MHREAPKQIAPPSDRTAGRDACRRRSRAVPNKPSNSTKTARPAPWVFRRTAGSRPPRRWRCPRRAGGRAFRCAGRAGCFGPHEDATDRVRHGWGAEPHARQRRRTAVRVAAARHHPSETDRLSKSVSAGVHSPAAHCCPTAIFLRCYPAARRGVRATRLTAPGCARRRDPAASAARSGGRP